MEGYKIKGKNVSVVNYSINNYNNHHSISFRGEEQGGLNIVTKPIDKVENIVQNTVDSFVPESENEEKKKSHKTAIRVGSTVLVLSAIVALLNPRFSSSLVNKLKTKSTKAGNKARVDNTIWGAWNKIKEKCLNGVTNTIQVLNNGNTFKDEMFQKLCGKTALTKKMHQGITKCFDKISKQTVYGKHKNVKKQMDTLDEIIKHYKVRLSPEDKTKLEEKLAHIDAIQEYFTSPKIRQRLEEQERLMKNLENDVVAKMKEYKDGFKGSNQKLKHSKDAFKFWAEEILMPQRNKLEEEGTEVVNSLVGDGKTQKGAYREVVDLLSPFLNKNEKSAFEDSVNQAEKLLRKANKTENIEYFDKKRDLVLGSAPTDVVTAIVSLIASGIAIGTADTKEDKLSRTISGALPVVAGLGVSTALTAMLFSGGKGMVLGTGSGMALSALGSTLSHKLFPKNPQLNIAENKTIKEAESEVKNA